MPTLNWIGKEAVVRHHEDLPFRVLDEVPGVSAFVDTTKRQRRPAPTARS